MGYKYAKRLKVLVFQYQPTYINLNSNIKKFERLVRKNLFLKPDLVIFPEYSLTGPLYSNYNLAFEKSNLIFEELGSLAKKYKIHLIPGSFVMKIGKNMYNSTCMIDDNGKILGFYHKRNLWSS